MKTRRFALGVVVLLAGCGSQAPVCTPGAPVTAVSPQNAKADHGAFPPGNQQQFQATSSSPEGPGCLVPAHILLLSPTWTVSDPQNVTISSAHDGTNGLATCLGSTKGPVTVTAHVTSSSGTTLLTAMLYCE